MLYGVLDHERHYEAWNEFLSERGLEMPDTGLVPQDDIQLAYGMVFDTGDSVDSYHLADAQVLRESDRDDRIIQINGSELDERNWENVATVLIPLEGCPHETPEAIRLIADAVRYCRRVEPELQEYIDLSLEIRQGRLEASEDVASKAVDHGKGVFELSPESLKGNFKDTTR